jgi:phosphoglycerol transferase MdoB-like AlkP superfamily enzyme
LGDFLEKLKENGTLDNTLVAIYGDHTGVHKYYSDKVEQITPAEPWWSDNDMRIPLIIYNKNLESKTIDIPAGQIDLMPTISYLMGVDKKRYENTTFGKVLVNTNKKYTILNNLSMRGNYSPSEEKHMSDGIKLSDKMVQSDYFKDK